MQEKIIQIRKKLEEDFGFIQTVEDGGRNRFFHLKDNELYDFGASATRFVDSFVEPFNSAFIAPFSAKKAGVSVEEILAQWQLKGDKGREKGTVIHEYIEAFYKGEEKPFEYFVNKRVAKWMDEDALYMQGFLDMVESFHKFYEKTKDYLLPVVLELPIGDPNYENFYRLTEDFLNRLQELESVGFINEEIELLRKAKGKFFGTTTEFMKFFVKTLKRSFTNTEASVLLELAKLPGIMGIVDALFYDTRDNKLYIYDWKQGKPIVKKDKYYKRLFYPFSQFYAVNFFKYSIQLTIYKQIFKNISGLDMGMRIVHFDKEYSEFDMNDMREYLEIYFNTLKIV